MHKNADECCGNSCSCEDDQNYFVEFGDIVPAFTVKSYDPVAKNIGEYTYEAGKWTVFYFYPADFTFV